MKSQRFVCVTRDRAQNFSRSPVTEISACRWDRFLSCLTQLDVRAIIDFVVNIRYVWADTRQILRNIDLMQLSR